MRGAMLAVGVWVLRTLAGVMALFAFVDFAYSKWLMGGIEVVVFVAAFVGSRALSSRRDEERRRLRPRVKHPETPLPPR